MIAPRSLALLLALLLPIATRAQPSESPLEPEIAKARDAALQRFPETLRERLARLTVVRQSTMAVPADAPMIYRLMGSAAQAMYSNASQTVTVFDAGATRRPGFFAPLNRVDEPALKAMLDDLAVALRSQHGDHPALWRAFATQVRSWDGENTAIPVDAPFGDHRVLDAFVHRGVERAMGRLAPPEQLIVHEYAHGLQLRDGLFFATRHMSHWGSLSGWQRDDGTPFDGYASGMFAMENPIVLARLLLDGERGESTYRPHPNARFVNRYARYDAREDFAESVRLFVYDPQKLIDLAPEKFLFINATGWCGMLDGAQPGPLWIGAEQIIACGWQPVLERAARRIMWPSADEPVVDLEVRAALIGAHADVLRVDQLPASHPASILPDDLPRDIRNYFVADWLRPAVGGIILHPDPTQFSEQWQRALLNHLSREHWDASIFELTEGMLDQPGRLHEAISELTEMEDIELRQQQAMRLLAHPVAWRTDRSAMQKLGDREIAHLVDADRPLLADVLRVSIVDDEARSAALGARSLDDLRNAADRAGASPDAIALHVALLERDPDRADPIAIPGQALGLVRRAEFRFRLIEQQLAADNKNGAGVALRACLEELTGSRHRHLVQALANEARQLAIQIDDASLQQSAESLLEHR